MLENERAPEKNVFGEPLQTCSDSPVTGFFRDGCCNTGPQDLGSHTVCVVMTAEFLAFSKKAGNDPFHARARVRFSGAEVRRPLVFVRGAVAAGLRGRGGAKGCAGGDARAGSGDRGAEGPQALRHRSGLSVRCGAKAPSPCPSPQGEKGPSNCPPPSEKGRSSCPLSPWGEGWGEGVLSGL